MTARKAGEEYYYGDLAHHICWTDRCLDKFEFDCPCDYHTGQDSGDERLRWCPPLTDEDIVVRSELQLELAVNMSKRDQKGHPLHVSVCV